MIKNKWWEEKKDEFINLFNSGKTGKQLAKHFGVSEASITRAIVDLGLKEGLVPSGDFKNYKVDWADKKDELENYINTEKLSLYQIAKKFGTSEGTVRRAIKKLGIERTSYKTGNRKIVSTSDEEFSKIVSESKSISEVLRKTGYEPIGGNHRTCKNRIKRLGLDISHFTGQLWSKGKTVDGDGIFVPNAHTLEDILSNKVNNVKSNTLKERLISAGYKERKCECCGLSTWNGKPIPIELHHIDGNHNNNSLSNLQILCPNCHAQTDFYCGRGNKNRTVYEVPTKEEILERLKLCKSATDTAKSFNVSETTLHSWIKKHSMKKEWTDTLKNVKKP